MSDIKWVNKNDYLKGIINKMNSKSKEPIKIASFDLDDTLIHRSKRGKGDWTLLFDMVPITINDLVNKGYAIIIFTNQSGMSKKDYDIETWKNNLASVIDRIFKNVKTYYCAIYVAKKYDLYRKPNLGLWSVMKTDLNVKISKKSFFCGDAAGREKDFSDTDRKFALNIKINFYTPEEVFMYDFKEQNEKYILKGFNPTKFLEEHKKDKFVYKFTPRKKELIIMVGYPGSGKSEFVNKYILSNGYKHVNQDTCGTNAKCLNMAKSAFEKNESVVIDNTNMGDSDRSKYIILAIQHGYIHIRCIYLNIDIELSKHLNNVRHVYSNGEIPKVNQIAYNIMKKKFSEPSKIEKFDKIEKIDMTYFDYSKLDNVKWNKLFMMYSEA